MTENAPTQEIKWVNSKAMNEKINTGKFKVPKGMRVYAIGDVHGHADLLKKMHEAISFDLLRDPPNDVHIVYLGDYVDRGPDSKGVLDALIFRMEQKDEVARTFLLGNHERGMYDFIMNPSDAERSDWLDWGGIETLASYGIKFETRVPLPSEKVAAAHALREAIPPNHMDFFEKLSYAVEIGGFFFAHAGVQPMAAINDQELDDLVFIREPFLSWPEPLSHMIVHGHTKTKGEPEILPHRINVDTGAFQTGILTAAVIEGNEVQFLSVKA